jgi:predicted dehydrogenase
MTKLRVAFVGAGFIAARHVANLATFEDVELVGIADVDIGRAQALAGRYGARPYAGFEQLLEQERPTALYVCVPPFAHGAVEDAAIAADIALFVEKPLALELATAERLAAAVNARGLVSATGYHWRYLDIVERATELLEDRPAHLALGYWLDVMPPPAWWGRQSESGGQMLEQTTHIFDLARVLVGEVADVRAEGSRVERPDAPGCDVHAVSTATLRFANGALGCVASTSLLHRPYRMGLHLFGDGLVLELSESELLVDTGHGQARHQATVDPILREDRDFIDAAAGGPDRVRVPYGEALKTHRLATAAATAAMTGTTVEGGDA